MCYSSFHSITVDLLAVLLWQYYANAVEFDIQIYYVLICENTDTSSVANKYANIMVCPVT